MLTPKTKKAQIVMSDLVISLGIFLLLLVVAYSAWERQVDQLTQWSEQARAQQTLERGMMALTQSPGNPSNWALLGVGPDNANIISVGLAQRAGVLDPQRVNRLAVFLNSSSTYNDTKKKMELGIYQVDIQISDTQDNVIAVMGNTPTSGTVSGVARSMAMYNQSMVQVRLRLWRNDTG